MSMNNQKLLTLTIARVDGPVFTGEVEAIVVPGIDGEMTILPQHVALISPLRTGTLTVVHQGGKRDTFPVTQGTLEVSNNQATVLI